MSSAGVAALASSPSLSCDPTSLVPPVLSDNSRAVLSNRYLAKEDGRVVESPESMFKRVADTVAAAEEGEDVVVWSRRFYEEMSSLRFLPNSPTLMNAGRDMNMLSACFVLPIPDSVDGIFSAMKNTALIQKAGGGTGFSFDSLRPSGAYIHSSGGTTSGPISFLRAFSGATNAIQQGAFRRGANMAMMSIEAPDCLKFVLMKGDLSQLTNYNISVKVPDAWMNSLGSGKVYRVYNFHSDKWYVVPRALLSRLREAVKKGRENPLLAGEVDSCYSIQDMTEVRPDEESPKGDWLTVDEVWNVVVSSARQTGEPGVCFIDRIRETEPTPHVGRIEASNPCVAAGSLVATERGWVPVENVKEGDLLWSQQGLHPVQRVEINHGCKLYRVEFSDGGYVDVTAAHRFKCVMGGRRGYFRLDEMAEGTRVVVESLPGDAMKGVPFLSLVSRKHRAKLLELGVDIDSIDLGDLGLIMGSIIGDGTFTDGFNPYQVRLSFGHNDAAWRQLFEGLLSKYNIKYTTIQEPTSDRIHSGVLGHLMEACGLKRATASEKSIPDSVADACDKELLRGLLDGLFSTDGCVTFGGHSVLLRLSSTSLQLCRQVRRIMLSFGLHAKIYTSSDMSSHMYNDPKYGPRKIRRNHAKMDLALTGGDIRRFSEVVGFSNPLKKDKLKGFLKAHALSKNFRTASVRSISLLEGEHTVYDLYNEETDEWNVDGYIQQGCGESYLLPNESCNLASVNLNMFVSVPPGKDCAEPEDVDFEGLSRTVKIAVRFLDDVISVNTFPTEDIDKICKANRKIGLGIMGLADVLFKLGVPYDSERGLRWARRLMACVQSSAMEAENELAESRGVFPNWEGSQWDQEHRNVRVRNAEVLSIAPTGTISIIAGCSCGIEPLFSLAFTRNVMGGVRMTEVHPFFKRLAKKKGFYSDELVQEAMEKGSIQHRADIPDAIKQVFVCAHDISPEWHIRMQATVQDYVSNSVSKTVNMPHSATVKDVDTAFRLAYNLKCKSTTVFRDGCRSEQPMQLLKSGDPVNSEQSIAPVDLPDILPAVRIRQKTAFGHIHLNISVDPETRRELEIFAHIGHAGGMEQADLEAICRLASLLLRGGYPLHKIIGQLYGIQTSLPKSDPSQITSLPRAIASALMVYMEKRGESSAEPVSFSKGGNGDASTFLNRLRKTPVDGYNLRCPYGEENCSGVLIRQGRCTVCTTCGVSSCG